MIEMLICLGVLLFSASGFWLGAWFSRLPGKGWAIGYGIGFVLVLLYWLGITHPAAAHVPPVSWLLQGRMKYAAIGFLAPLLVVPLLPRLRRRTERLAIVCFLILLIGGYSIWPFVASQLNHDFLCKLATRIDTDGVCLQSTDYTCGPASAVTALRRLGIQSDEGAIAIAAHCSQTIGTPPDMLCAALNEMFGSQGILCDYRAFDNLDDLKNAGLTLMVIRFGSMVDHYVTVMQVTDKEVVVGDPLNGMVKISRPEFLTLWKKQGVVVKRLPRV